MYPGVLYAEIDEDATPAADWVLFYADSGSIRPTDVSILSEFLPFQTVSNGQTGLRFINHGQVPIKQAIIRFFRLGDFELITNPKIIAWIPIGRLKLQY